MICELSRIGKSIETESRCVVVGGGGIGVVRKRDWA